MRLLLGGFLLILSIIGMVFFFGERKHKPFSSNSPYSIQTGGHGRKKILIFSSRGGGGHISVTNALFEYLGNEYTLGSTYIFSDILGRFDPIYRLTWGRNNQEDLYNYLIKRKWNLPINMSYDVVSIMYSINQRKIEATIEQYLQEHTPDLIISVIPIINNMILNVAQKLNIPFLLIPTDLDPRIAINRIYKPNYDKFYFALSYNDPLINEKIAPAQIPEKNISYVGFPVKKSFLDPHEDRKTKKDFKIPTNRPTILVLMGAQGSRDLYNYTKQLTRLKMPAHILIAIGKSEHLRPSLEKIKFPPHLSRTIIGFTNRIPDLMAASDLIISKSGSVSVNEAIYANLPIFLEGTSSVLWWEKFNQLFIKNHQFGGTIRNYSSIVSRVEEVFMDPNVIQTYKENLEKFHKPNTEHEIRRLIREIFKKEVSENTEYSPDLHSPHNSIVMQ